MQAAFVIPRDQVAVGGRRDQIRNGTGIVHYHRGLRLLIRLGAPAGYATKMVPSAGNRVNLVDEPKGYILRGNPHK